MKSETSPLLDAVLGGPPEFRADSLARTLGQVRRRKRTQRRRRGALALTLALAAGSLLFPWSWRSPVVPEAALIEPAAVVSVPVVQSQAPPAGLIVVTRPNVTRVVESAPGSVALVETAVDGRPVPELTDDELLRLVASRPAALVRIGGEVQLVIADGEPPNPVHANP